jgi:drug/metabolite transporter (DMT)-like permease
VAGFGLYLVCLTLLPSSVTNLVVSTEPAFTALFAYGLLGERMGGAQVAGAVLILLGVAALRGEA